MCQIQKRLGRKKVLVVLDDVDNIEQLQFLAGSREWFGCGSKIMITTRDEHLLCCAQEKYVPELLNETEAMKLFSRYAFRESIPLKEFVELSGVVVGHTGHLPLALKVLGSHFCGRNLDFWQSELRVLAKIPHDEINKILKLSYDRLNIREKKIFLHIACLFKGMKRNRVTRILDAVGFEAASGITVLIEKPLLTISEGELHMHDLIQEMGQCIAREEYPNTMVLVTKEIEEVMTSISRLEIVEAMVEPENSDRPIECCSAEILKSMKKLRLLDIRGRFTSNEPTCFPEQLRWLSWLCYPFHSLRITRDMTKLVGLQMTNSAFINLQIENKVILPNLKFINLEFSKLTVFPSVLGLPNLEWLNLSCCYHLKEIHESVFLHEKIFYLNLTLCGRNLPTCIQMKSLHTLLLADCFCLETFPEVSMDMERLSVLNISGLTTIRNDHCRTIGSLHLGSLREPNLYQNLVDDSFLSNMHTKWPSLEEFNLSCNAFTRLPSTISQLSHLKHLDLSYCTHLKELHELPPLIQVLKANGCTSLEKIGDLSNTYNWLFKISFKSCLKLLKNGESQSHIANLLMKSFLQKCAAVNHRLSIMAPGSKIPTWFSKQQSGNKIELYLPESQISSMIGLAICCRLPLNNLTRFPIERSVFIRINVKPSYGGNLIGCSAHPAKNADGVWVGYMPIDIIGNLFHGFEYERFIISFDNDFDDVVECGVCVVYKDDIKPLTEIESRISDYDKLGWIDQDSARTSEDLQHGRWSLPTFNFNYLENIGQNSVVVNI